MRLESGPLEPPARQGWLPLDRRLVVRRRLPNDTLERSHWNRGNSGGPNMQSEIHHIGHWGTRRGWRRLLQVLRVARRNSSSHVRRPCRLLVGTKCIRRRLRNSQYCCLSGTKSIRRCRRTGTTHKAVGGTVRNNSHTTYPRAYPDGKRATGRVAAYRDNRRCSHKSGRSHDVHRSGIPPLKRRPTRHMPNSAPAEWHWASDSEPAGSRCPPLSTQVRARSQSACDVSNPWSKQSRPAVRRRRSFHRLLPCTRLAILPAW